MYNITPINKPIDTDVAILLLVLLLLVREKADIKLVLAILYIMM